MIGVGDAASLELGDSAGVCFADWEQKFTERSELAVANDDTMPVFDRELSLDLLGNKYALRRAKGDWSLAMPTRRPEDERNPRIADGG